MFDEKKLDKDTQIAYLKNSAYGGFGLWWACMLLGALLPDEYISNDGRMWLLIAAMSYALVIVGAIFWSGYSRKAREITNESEAERREQLESALWSALGGATCLFLYRTLISGDAWVESAIVSLLIGAFIAGFTYFVTLRKPKDHHP